jgi:hypothetical protein
MLGLRKDLPTLGTVQLAIGGVVVATATGTAPTAGNWSNFELVYSSVVADIGKTVTIRLVSNGAQANFDDVRLDAALVPEPLGLTLVGLGLTMLGALRRKRP